MNLLFHELKKIWRPSIIAVIILLGLMYYFMFSSFNIEYFNNGDSAEASFALSADWSKKYGTTIEADERAELDAQLAEEMEKFTERLKSYDEPAKYGFSDWESFEAFRQSFYKQAADNGGKVDMVVEAAIQKIISGTNFFTLQTLMDIMDIYDNLAKGIPETLNYKGSDDSAATKQKVMSRVEEIKSSDMVRGYLPFEMLNTTNSYLMYLTIWAVLSVILLLAPILVRDRLHRMRCMQWSSRKGRRILNMQFSAAAISAAVLSLINLIAYAIPFLMQHPLIFKDFKLFSFQIFSIPWFDWTYGQYLLIIAVIIFALAVAAGLLTAFLSQYSTNYVVMLLKALPLFAVLAFICTSWVVNQAFYTDNSLSSSLALPGAEFMAAGLIAALSVVLCAIACYRQHRRELYSV